MSPSWVPAMVRPTASAGAEILAPRRCCNSLSAGPTSRSMERTFAAAQPGRSVTFARACPCAECHPVAALTSSSARAVSSSNCACSEEDRYDAGAGFKISARAATRVANPQSTMPGPAWTGVRSVPAVVLPAFGFNRLGHPLNEAVGHPVLAPVGDHLAQFRFELGRAPAGAAIVEVDPDLLPALLCQLAVEIGVQLVHRLFAVDLDPEQAGRPRRGVLLLFHVFAHSLDPPGTLPTRPRASATSCNAFWSALLPRWILLMTVPIGTSVISEISL